MNLKVAVTVILILLAGITLVAHFSTTTLEFSRYNRGWNGTSNLFTELEAPNTNDLISYDDLAGRNDTLLLIIAPGESFSDRESIAIRYFVENGNTLFIADETGASNRLLSYIQSGMRIEQEKIVSVQDISLRSSLVIGHTRKFDPLLANVSALTLNRPSVVHGGEALVITSFLTWEDLNMNYNLDMNENLSSHGVLARNRVGKGTVYVLSDPSVFVNGMQKESFSGNKVFIQNLLSLHRDILIEQSHSLTAGSNFVIATVMWLENTTFIKISVLFISILFVAVAFRRRWI